MRLIYARISVAGPVREINEDTIDFWESEDPIQREKQGSVALLADGLGGHAHGEVASRLAVDEAKRLFQKAPTSISPYELLRKMFNIACSRVHDTALIERKLKMATTLVVSVFRHRTVYIGYIGDSRAYHLRNRTLSRLTQDHIATALPVKLRLMLEREAMASPQRNQLTRSLGSEAFCQPEFTTLELKHDDVILQCTDGLHGYVLDEEIATILAKNHPYDACRELVALAERRGSDDNISLQLIAVRDWEKVSHPPHKLLSHGGNLVAAGLGDLRPGMLLDGRFELTDLVARSNMSSIFRARDCTSDETVALKVPLMSLESDIAGYERFKREEEVGTKLNHPSILKVLKVEGVKSRPYLVMEFLDGNTLAQTLSKRRPLPEFEAIKYAGDICDALAYLHANGIVHRDLKPQNVMLCSDGSLRLFDFGIAHVDRARRLTFAGLSPAMGTPDYMSPEQVKGKRGDHRSDIYSLGAILYEMATGSTPFEGESPYVVMNARVSGDAIAPRQLNSKVSPALEEIILHALERDPSKRFQSAAEIKKELENYELVQLTDRHLRLRAPQPWKKMPKLWQLIPLVLLLQALLFLAMYWYFKSHHR